MSSGFKLFKHRAADFSWPCFLFRIPRMLLLYASPNVLLIIDPGDTPEECRRIKDVTSPSMLTNRPNCRIHQGLQIFQTNIKIILLLISSDAIAGWDFFVQWISTQSCSSFPSFCLDQCIAPIVGFQDQGFSILRCQRVTVMDNIGYL